MGDLEWVLRAPEQSRLQRVAMKAAGVLMRANTPTELMERMAIDVGGYERIDDPLQGPIYKADIKPGMKMSLSDETTKSSIQWRHKSAGDHYDATTGVSLENAAARAIKHNRSEGVHARTLRGRAARRLTHYATHKGMTVPSLLSK